MASILIKGGRVVDPASGRDEVADVLVSDGTIAEVGRVKSKPDETVDAAGKIVCPGLIDMHVHLREPGSGEVETIASGAASAIAGGFATVAAMPNTEPAIDSAVLAKHVRLQAQRAGLANVLVVGTLTRGRRGEELSGLSGLARAGVVGFSDDGDPVADSGLMRRVMEYVRVLDRPVISHAEDKALSAAGVMHEGAVSVRLGLPGIPAASEEAAVERDIQLARLTGCRLHLCHLSTAGAVRALRRAKEQGLPVTAEVTTHHLTLTDGCLLERTDDDEKILRFDTSYKMNPPLRTREDMEALREALRDGTIDCIVSDHAPHPPETKELEFTEAAFGVVGLETTLPVLITELVEPGILSWPQAIAALTIKPAEVLGVSKGTLTVGADADITLIDPDCQWTIDRAAFRSKSANTPFHGRKVKGRAVGVMVAGVVKGA